MIALIIVIIKVNVWDSADTKQCYLINFFSFVHLCHLHFKITIPEEAIYVTVKHH